MTKRQDGEKRLRRLSVLANHTRAGDSRGGGFLLCGPGARRAWRRRGDERWSWRECAGAPELGARISAESAGIGQRAQGSRRRKAGFRRLRHGAQHHPLHLGGTSRAGAFWLMML